MLDTYLLALVGQPINAFRSVIYKLLSGTWSADQKFVPRPPELANFVRQEAALIRRINAPKSLPAPRDDKSSMQMQMEKRWEGQAVLMENVTIDQMKILARQRTVPAGAIYVAVLQRVFAKPPFGFFGEKAISSSSPALQRWREQRGQSDGV